MPTFTELFVNETSRNVGFEAGKFARTATLSVLPLTEMSAELGFVAVTLTLVLVPAEDRVDGLVEDGLVEVPPLDGCAAPPVVQPPLKPEPLAHLTSICCVNGSLLRKRLNASSWPD